MKVAVRNRVEVRETYRVARTMSLFNSPAGTAFDADFELPIEAQPWKLGLVVGPSGSGKTSLGRQLGDPYAPRWPDGEAIIDAISPGGSFDAATAALSAVGLGTVPSWLRPYAALSTGEQFRADLARVLCERGGERPVVIDEFTSVVDRQIAKIGALAFAKAWKRGDRQAVLLSCHYDIVEWLQPDWTLDTQTGEFTWGCLQPRPRIEVEVVQTDWRWWPLFEPHHYLKVSRMPFSKCYVALVEGEPVAHLAVSSIGGRTRSGGAPEARACRLVVMPEWQGAGVGMRFLNNVCDHYLRTGGHLPQPTTSVFHTSHPGLCAALRRDPHWTQLTARLYGQNKTRRGKTVAGFGGHFRAVQSFRYVGSRP